MNFSWRNECNQCKAPKPDGPGGGHLIWGKLEMIDVAEEDMIGAATGPEEGTMGASEGAGMVETEVVLALARWTPGASTDRIAGRGHISLSPEVLEQLFLYPVLPLLFCKLTIQDCSWIFFGGGGQRCVCMCVSVCQSDYRNCNHISGSH